LADEAALELQDLGVQLGLALDVEGAKIREEVEEAVQQGLSPIIVGGGDGTQSLAAEVLKNTGIPMGILPLGTGNALARDLGIPVDLRGACLTIASGIPVDVDLGEANGKVFVNLCSLGLTVGIEEALNPEIKHTIGRAAYVSAVATALRQRSEFELTVSHQGATSRVVTLLAGCGPGNTQGGVLPLPGQTSHQSGELSFYAVDSLDLVKYAELLWRLRHGTDEAMMELLSIQAGEITLTAEPCQIAIIDGEPATETPVTLRCLPGALRVLVPRPPDGAGS
jgi:diacylglycerol kinase family enzyme